MKFMVEIQADLKVCKSAIFNEKCKKVFPLTMTQMFWPKALSVIPTTAAQLAKHKESSVLFTQ